METVSHVEVACFVHFVFLVRAVFVMFYWQHSNLVKSVIIPIILALSVMSSLL